jgi:hypothetical protein
MITESISKVRRIKSWKVTFCQGVAVYVTVTRTIFFLCATLHELGWSKILLKNRNNSFIGERSVGMAAFISIHACNVPQLKSTTKWRLSRFEGCFG